MTTGGSRAAGSHQGLKRGPVTVVITAYNAERYIARCIESALTQTCGLIHVIVVDDGSSDGTSQMVGSYGDSVELIRLPENSGPAVGRTTGLMNCATEYIAFLDADDYWKPSFVRETVSFLDANPETIAVSTGYCKHDWNGREYIRPVLDDEDRAYYGRDGRNCTDFYQFWSKYRAVLTGTVMMRTEVALKTGGQRADLRLTQDLEFWGYLATFGDWAFIPKPLFVTDEKVLTPKERLSKFKRRFEFFQTMTVDEWARRIRPRLNGDSRSEGFERFLGHIATTIVLANAYSFRFAVSYRLAKEWDAKLDTGLGSVLRWGVRGGPVLWPLVCLAWRLRETMKAYWRVPADRLCHAADCNG